MRMRRDLWPLGIVALGLLVGGSDRAAAVDILVFDGNTTNHRAQDAVTSLGYNLTVGDVDSFNTLLTGGTWDAVVVDAPSSFPDWSPLVEYIANGGKVIMSFWTLQTEDAVAAAFQVSVNESFNEPLDVFVWDPSHPVFTTPNAVGDLTEFTDQWADDGDKLNLVPLSGATAIAGFTSSPELGQAAIVIGNDGRTIYNGFLFDEATQSVPLIANQIQFLVAGPVAVPEPSTFALSGLGVTLGGLGAWRRRRRARATA